MKCSQWLEKFGLSKKANHIISALIGYGVRLLSSKKARPTGM